uniref:Max dimerization protein 3 n=1 Tax=Cairina moschata TaxID=8855 RepID=A0A8C3CWA5_CAIMO
MGARPRPLGPAPSASPTPPGMEPAGSSIQALLRAAEFLERRERGTGTGRGNRAPTALAEAEHGYASLCPARARQAAGGDRSVHNALEKHRRAQLRRCLEQLKQQVPAGTGSRPTTLSLLHRARLHIQRLQEQEVRARRVKERLRSQQQSLRQRLERLLGPAGSERLRADSLGADSLDSSRLSEHSGSDGGECGKRGRGRGGVAGRLPGADPRCRAQRRQRWMWRARCSARSCRRWPPSAPGGTTATPAPAGPGPDSAAFRTPPASSCWKCRCRTRRPGTGHRGIPGRAGHGAANGPRCAQQSTSRGAEEALAAGPAVAGTQQSLKLPAAGSGQRPALPGMATGLLCRPPGPGRGSECAEHLARTPPMPPRPPSLVHTRHYPSKGTWSNPPPPPPCYSCTSPSPALRQTGQPQARSEVEVNFLMIITSWKGSTSS